MFSIPTEDVRQDIFAAHFHEFDERYGSRFALAWHYGHDPALIEVFHQTLATKLAGCSLDELGAALCSDEPDRWKEREQLAWIFLLGSDALRPVSDENRNRLVGLAYIYGKFGQARQWGIKL